MRGQAIGKDKAEELDKDARQTFQSFTRIGQPNLTLTKWFFLNNKICTLKKVAIKRYPAINESKYTKSAN